MRLQINRKEGIYEEESRPQIRRCAKSIEFHGSASGSRISETSTWAITSKSRCSRWETAKTRGSPTSRRPSISPRILGGGGHGFSLCGAQATGRGVSSERIRLATLLKEEDLARYQSLLSVSDMALAGALGRAILVILYRANVFCERAKS